MRTIIISILLIVTHSISARNIKDMAGRNVTIPDNINRILPYDSKTSILLFPVAQNIMSAKAIIPGSKKFKYISDEYNQLPEVDIKNIESVLIYNPQIIIAGTFIESDNFDRFNKLQNRTKIPVVMIDLSITKLRDTYKFLSSILPQNEACELCITYLNSIYNQSENIMRENKSPEIGIYYTIGGSGLMTDPSGSKHTEILDYLNLNNIAKISLPNGGHANVNMEQIIEWNPDYIFTAGFKADKNAYMSIKKGSIWQNITAVKNNKIYKVPSKPFGWFDHPPTVNRIPGVIWLSHIFYNLSEEQMKTQIKTFYHLFYKYKLTDLEFNSLF